MANSAREVAFSWDEVGPAVGMVPPPRKQRSMRPLVTTKARMCGTLACLVMAAAAFGCTGSIGDRADDAPASPTSGPATPGGPSEPAQPGSATTCTSTPLPRTLQRIPNLRYANAARDPL